ncbi:MAG: secretion system protein [Halanaeroarchaeum sp.]
MVSSFPATVPPPTPPDATDAWYAETVRAQYVTGPNVVATVREDGDGFVYGVREPPQSDGSRAAVDAIERYLDPVDVDRPRTREGTIERVEAGLGAPLAGVLDREVRATPAQRRSIEYHLIARVQGLAALTPLALDDRIRIADASDECLVVHTSDFAPARTAIDADVPLLDRFRSERLEAYTVEVFGRDVPVTVYREHLLGGDAFDAKYHVHAPDRLPGDEAVIGDVETVIVDESVGEPVPDREAYVRHRARTLLARRLRPSPVRSLGARLERWVDRALARVGLAGPRPPSRDRTDRVARLADLVVRDLVGEDRLTVPIRDPRVERIEVNGVGDRVKVVPTLDTGGGRMPTTIAFDDERRLVALATRLAAAGGVELGPRRPAATVQITPADGPIDCSVGLPTAGASGTYVSIDKRGVRPVTAVTLLEASVVEPSLVAVLWLAVDRGMAIAIVGPETARPAALLEALAPFVPFEDRPVVVTAGPRTVTLPHETGVTLRPDDWADGADVDRRVRDLAPDVTILPTLATDAATRSFADALAAGRGVLAAGTAADAPAFGAAIGARGVPPATVAALDLAVEVTVANGDPRATGIRMPTRAGTGQSLAWESVALDGGDGVPFRPVLAALARGPGDTLETLAADFRRRRRYVEYLEAADVRTREDLFSFLSDLRTDEAATLERIHGVLSE